jgi:lipopolysaccharide transport system ATP-binding protein
MGLDVEIISVSKTYPLGNNSLSQLCQSFFQKKKDGFTALKDINLHFESGKTVGIIGLNGSGKSTLLQILAGTLRPDYGFVRKPSDTHALLELGSGFNPDFTGMENARLVFNLHHANSINIDDYLRDVEDFADVGEFFYYPIRTYSSGMMARVAFAVHANLHPSLFIIDEAIAVGDLPFQTKCFSFLKRLASSGSTIIFVSHDIPLIRSFCDEVVYLESGKVVASGDPISTCDQYVRRSMLGKSTRVEDINLYFFSTEKEEDQRAGNGKARFSSVGFTDNKNVFEYGDDIRIFAEININEHIRNLNFGATILDKTGQQVCYTDSMLEGNSLDELNANDATRLDLSFRCILSHGYYTFCLVLSEMVSDEPTTLDYFPQSIGFEVCAYKNKIHAFCKLDAVSQFVVK